MLNQKKLAENLVNAIALDTEENAENYADLELRLATLGVELNATMDETIKNIREQTDRSISDLSAMCETITADLKRLRDKTTENRKKITGASSHQAPKKTAADKLPAAVPFLKNIKTLDAEK